MAHMTIEQKDKIKELIDRIGRRPDGVFIEQTSAAYGLVLVHWVNNGHIQHCYYIRDEGSTLQWDPLLPWG